MSTPSITYDGPLHQRLQNPTEEELRELIFSTDHEYWLAGSGDAQLRFIDGEFVANLGLKKLSPYGFRLLFKSSELDDMMVAVSDEGFDETIVVFSGGEYYNEPISLFFDEETTFRVVKDFCGNGGMSSAIRWEKWININWEENSE